MKLRVIFKYCIFEIAIEYLQITIYNYFDFIYNPIIMHIVGYENATINSLRKTSRIL